MGSSSNVGLLFTIDADSTQAQQALANFKSQTSDAMTSAAGSAEPFNRAILNQHQAVHLLSEELGIRLPRAVVSGISEMLPPINMIGPALMGAFAVDMLVKFGEGLHKMVEDMNEVTRSEKEIADAAKEIDSQMEKMARKSEDYARKQVTLLIAQAAAEQSHVDKLKEYQDISVSHMGAVGLLWDKVAGKTKELDQAEDHLKQTQALRNALITVLGEDEVQAHEKAARAAEKAAREQAEGQKKLNALLLNQIGIRSQVNAELQKGAQAADKAIQEEIAATNRLRMADLQFLAVLDNIGNAMQHNAALARTAGGYTDQVTQTKHLLAARKELIWITQDLRKTEKDFTESARMSIQAVQEDMASAMASVAEGAAGLIGGQKAAAVFKAGYEVAEGIACLASGTWPPNPAAIIAAGLHFEAAGQYEMMAGGGGGGSRGGGGGGGGSQSSYGRGGGGSGSGSGDGGSVTPGSGTTVHMHLVFPHGTLISTDTLPQLMRQMTDLAKGGQATLGASYAMTNQGRLT